jgi:signal transduction histidine kinase
MKRVCLFLFFSFIAVQLITQVDSLQRKMEEASASQQIDILLQLSDLYSKQSPELSFENAKKAYDLAKNNGSIQQKLNSSLRLGKCYFLLNKFTDAKKIYLEALKLARKHEKTNFLAKIYNNLGIYYWLSENNKELALQNYKQSVEYYLERDSSSENLLNAILSIGDIYTESNEPQMAIQNYYKALELAQQRNYEDKGDIYNSLGIAYKQIADYKRAMQYFNKSLEYYSSKNDKTGVAFIYNNIGNVYIEWEKPQQALEYFNKSLIIHQELKDSLNIAKTYNNIASTNERLKQYDSALTSYKHALDILQKNDHADHNIPIILSNIGVIYRAKGDLQKALDYNLEAIKKVEKDRHKLTISIILGEIYLAKNMAEQAEKYLKKAETLANELSSWYHLMQIHQWWAQLFENSGEFKQALQQYKLYKSYSDSVFNQENRNYLTELQAKQTLSEKEDKIDTLEQQNQLKRMKLEQNALYRRLFIVFLVILVLIIYMLIRWAKNKHRMNQQLSNKNKEIARQHQDLEQAYSKLKELQLTLETKVEKAVKELREKEQMLIMQSRQAAMGEMIGNIAHQWRQPLSAVAVIVQDLEDSYTEGELDDDYLNNSIDKVMDQLQYMSRTIDDFRNFFSPNKQPLIFSIKHVVNKLLRFTEVSFRHSNIEVELEIQADPHIEGFPNEYSQVVLNIMNNAREILKKNRKVNRVVKICLKEENEKSVLTISNNGGKIQRELLPKIFEPYFTTKEEGTGLGLYMSQTIIEKNMKGKLLVSNIKDGAEFKIII